MEIPLDQRNHLRLNSEEKKIISLKNTDKKEWKQLA